MADISPDLFNKLISDYGYHPPSTDEVRHRHEAARTILLNAAGDLARLTDASREQSLMFTKLEEAMFWANADIARHQRGADEIPIEP